MPVGSYNPALATARDRMRHVLGDMDVSALLREDAEYDALLGQYTEPEATRRMAESLASEYAQQPDQYSDGSLTVSWRERVKTWLALAARLQAALEAEAAAGGRAILASQVTRADVTTEAEYLRPLWWSG